MENQKYWACWMAGGSGPSQQHGSKEIAIAEASRLAAKNGRTVFVLEAIGFAEPPTPPAEYKEL